MARRLRTPLRPLAVLLLAALALCAGAARADTVNRGGDVEPELGHTQLHEFLRAATSESRYEHYLRQDPRALIELHMKVQRAPTNASTGCPSEEIYMRVRMQHDNGSESPDDDASWVDIAPSGKDVVPLTREAGKMRVYQWDLVAPVDVNELQTQLRMLFETNSPTPVSFEFVVLQLNVVGRQQVIIAAVLLVLVYILIIFELVHRTIAAMLGAGVMLVILTILRERPEIAEVVTWIDEGTIGLLLGMMIIIGVFSTTGFFEYGAVKAFKMSKGRVWRLALILCVLTAVLSAFLDNVTTMLLIAPVTLRLAKVVNLPPIPLLLAEVFFSNIGGTGTMIGDPPNIIIGSMIRELNFVDFMVNLAPALLVAGPFCFLLLRFMFRNQLHDRPCDDEIIADLEREYVIRDRRLFIKVLVVLAFTILFFFLEPVLELEPAWAALAGAAVLLVIATPQEIEPFLEKVEWSTLLFFAGLFILIEGLAEMGLIRAIGDGVAALVQLAPCEQQLLVACVLLLWISALASAFIDNIPYTATMVPVILQLSTDENLLLPLRPLAWSLAFGACLGGNGTLIGASANVVTCGIADQAGYRIYFLEFMKYGFPLMLLSVAITTVYVILVYPIGQLGFAPRVGFCESETNSSAPLHALLGMARHTFVSTAVGGADDPHDPCAPPPPGSMTPSAW